MECGWRMQLSPVDTRMLRFGLRVLFVFPPPSSEGAPHDLDKLRQSFDQLVQEDAEVFIDAERYRDEETGGLWLRTRHGTHARQLIEVQEDETITRIDHVLETTPLHLIPARPDTQALSVKCILLIDGGLIIAVNAAHCIVDAEGLALLMKRWSQNYSEASFASVRFSHDRRQLIPPRSDTSTMPHPEYRCICHASTQDFHSVAPRPLNFSTSQHRFHLSPTKLRNLKAFAAFGRETPPFSTLDCVTALLTWLITRSRGHSNAVQVSTAVNLRRRVQPPLPEHFTGNAVLPALSNHPVQDLDSASSGPNANSLHAIARRVRESIAKFDDAYIRDTLSLLAAHPDPDTLQPAVHFSSGPDILFSSWRGLGMADINFGSRPAYAGPPTLQHTDGVVIFLDQVDNQPGLNALVFLELEAMHKLIELWRQHVEVAAFAHTLPGAPGTARFDLT